MSALPDRLAARVWPFIPLASHAPVPRSEYSHEEFSHWNATWKQLHLRDPMGARYAPVRALISDTDPGGRVLHFTGPRKPWLPEQHLSSLQKRGLLRRACRWREAPDEVGWRTGGAAEV